MRHCSPPLLSLLLILLASAAMASSAPLVPAPAPPPGFDPLWLRYPIVSGAAGHSGGGGSSSQQLLAEYRSLLGTSAVVACEACGDAISRSQLSATAEELQTGLRGLLGTVFNATVRTGEAPAAGAEVRLLATVLRDDAAPELGTEGFRIRQSAAPGDVVHIEAATPSGLLYGAFKLLSLIQQHKDIPRSYDSNPAMELRVWDLWDNADGSIEQGFSGRSILWPYALLDDDRPPPRNKLFLRKCNASDAWQQWQLAAAPSSGSPGINDTRSTIVNAANDECLSSEALHNPMQTAAASNATPCTRFNFNSNGTISDASLGHCMDVQFGEGPVIQVRKTLSKQLRVLHGI